jgi:hypothetical protein
VRLVSGLISSPCFAGDIGSFASYYRATHNTSTEV